MEQIVENGRAIIALQTLDGKFWKAAHATSVLLNTKFEQHLIDNQDSHVGQLTCTVHRLGGGRNGVPQKQVIRIKVTLISGEETCDDIENTALLNSVFKTSSWVAPAAAGLQLLQQPDEEETEVIDGDIVAKSSKTYLTRRSKDGQVDTMTVLMNFVIVKVLNIYQAELNGPNAALAEDMTPVYELLIEYEIGESGVGTKIIESAEKLLLNDLHQFRRLRIPVLVSGTDMSHIKTLIDRFTSTCPLLLVLNLSPHQFRIILAKKQEEYIAKGGKVLGLVESFGLVETPFQSNVFLFSNGAVRVDTGEFVPLSAIGRKLWPRHLIVRSQLANAFWPHCVPCESPVLRLRYLRTMHHVLKRFVGQNYDVAMSVLAMYFSASSFNKLQHHMSGCPIISLVSEEGSTGKTELLKLFGSLVGMHSKGMCAFATEAGLYELFKRMRSMVIVLDDLQYDPKEGRQRGVDEVTIKSLYDAMQRVVMGKMVEATSMVVMTLNGHLMPGNQPVQSRQLSFKYRKNHQFDPHVLGLCRDMMAIGPMIAPDAATWPFSESCLSDCIQFMGKIMLNDAHSVGVRSAQNYAPVLYRHIQLGVLLLYETADWDRMFKFFAVECNRTNVEFSANAGIVARFIDAFQNMMRISNPKDNHGDSLHVHNLRVDAINGVSCYVLLLDEVVRVMVKQLKYSKSELAVKSLRLALSDIQGVSRVVGTFYDNNRGGFPAYAPAVDDPDGGPPERQLLTQEDLDESNSVPRAALAVPRVVLDRPPESAVHVDPKGVVIERNGRPFNFYQAVLDGHWKGIKEVLSDTELGRAQVHHGLTEIDDWADEQVRQRQYELCRNMKRKFRPENMIPFFDECGRPKSWVPPQWDDCFMGGHDFRPHFTEDHVRKFIVIETDGTTFINGAEVRINWCRAVVYEVPMPGARIVSVDPELYGDVVLDNGTVIQNPPPLCFVDEASEADLIRRHLENVTSERLHQMRDERDPSDHDDRDRDDDDGDDNGSEHDHHRGDGDNDDDDDDDHDNHQYRGDGNNHDWGDDDGGELADEEASGDDDWTRSDNDESDDVNGRHENIQRAYADWVEQNIIRGRSYATNQCPKCMATFADDLCYTLCSACNRTCETEFLRSAAYREAADDRYLSRLGDEAAIDDDMEERARMAASAAQCSDDAASLLATSDEEDDDHESVANNPFVDDEADEDSDHDQIGRPSKRRRLVVRE